MIGSDRDVERPCFFVWQQIISKLYQKMLDNIYIYIMVYGSSCRKSTGTGSNISRRTGGGREVNNYIERLIQMKALVCELCCKKKVGDLFG